MRSGFYQNTLGRIPAFKKRFELMFLLCSILLCGLDVRGQVPKMFQFQGVARNADGKIVANKAILVNAFIENPDDGQFVFGGLYQSTSNAQGIFTIAIGGVDLSNGNSLDMSLNDWVHKHYLLKLFIDTVGDGLHYNELESVPLLSVPYAFVSNHAAYAEKAGSVNNLTHDLPIIQTGTTNGPALPAVGIGNKLIWYPKKASFRVGQVTGTQWEDTQIGNNSFASGLDVVASGSQSTSIGTGLVSKASGGTVLGTFNNVEDNPNGGGNDRILQIGNGSGTNDLERSNAITVLRNGRVGIGNFARNPYYLLDVAGRMRIQHQDGETAGIHLNTATNALGSFIGMKTDDQVGLFIGDNWRFWVNAQGNGYLNGNILQTSDRRLKRNFSPVANSLSKLTNLTGQHYFWKDTTKSQELQTGLIAQEVEQYFPELVTTDDKGFKAVNYIGLIPHLI
ncbi:tail fiber domain-containing protein, partial [Dyadobacter sp. CY343]|uniref:tail fiber domain-containing protein n=1 Tax=Dyadobacter sp. CY343 TaxID=2907299 RepID=UPI001F451149